MSQTSYQAALPRGMLLYYYRLFGFFCQEVFGGKLNEVVVAIGRVRDTGEFDSGEIVANGDG